MISTESAFDVLKGDTAGFHLREIRDELMVMRGQLKRSMDAGLSPSEMTVARALLDAVESADHAAVKVHEAMNS